MSNEPIETYAHRPAHTRRRSTWGSVVFGLVILFSVATAVPLLAILIELITKGWHQLNLDFFSQVVPSSIEAMLAKQNGEPIPGGILNGIVGTLIMVGLASLISIPIGVVGGIYLHKNRKTKLAAVIRTLVDILQGVPSIICGILVYMWVVRAMHSYSAVAGAVSLALMMMPMITRSTEEALNMLPGSLLESGLALGSSYTSVMFHVLLPSALGAIITGILLSISRVTGETAPLMVTALGATYVNADVTSPTSAVSLLIWEFYNDPNLVDLIWSTALFLLILILILNLIAKSIASKWSINR
jgi:phosphate transport system permease protein